MHNFKRAIKTSLLFVLFIALFSVGIMAFYFEGENYFYQTAKERASLAGEIDYLIVGASHATRGFNPKIIDEILDVDSYNASSMSITSYGRYYMLKKEMARNPVKTVVMEVSFETIRDDRDENGLEGELYMLGQLDSPWERISYWFSALKPSEYGSAYLFFRDNGLDCFKRFRKGEYKTIQNSPYFYKGYKAYECDEPEFSGADIDYTEVYHNRKSGVSGPNDYNIEYLDKMVELCRENDIDLILITVPVSDYRIAKYTDIENIRQWYADYADENGIDFYDFNLLKNRSELFDDNKDFQDNQHLYNTGADTFSKEFATLMKERAEGKDISSYFFETYPDYEKTKGWD